MNSVLSPSDTDVDFSTLKTDFLLGVVPGGIYASLFLLGEMFVYGFDPYFFIF